MLWYLLKAFSCRRPINQLPHPLWRAGTTRNKQKKKRPTKSVITLSRVYSKRLYSWRGKDMAKKHRIDSQWKFFMLSALLSTGCLYSHAGERHRGGTRRTVVSTTTVKTITPKPAEEQENSDLWPMRGPVPADPVLDMPEERIPDATIYPAPPEQSYGQEGTVSFIPPPVMPEEPSVLRYKQDPPPQERYEPSSEEEEVATRRRKGMRVKRRKVRGTGKSAFPLAPAEHLDAGNEDPFMHPDMLPDPLSNQEPYDTPGKDADYASGFIDPYAPQQIWDTQTIPQHPHPSQSPDGSETGSEPSQSTHYDKYSDIISTQPEVQERSQEEHYASGADLAVPQVSSGSSIHSSVPQKQEQRQSHFSLNENLSLNASLENPKRLTVQENLARYNDQTPEPGFPHAGGEEYSGFESEYEEQERHAQYLQHVQRQNDTGIDKQQQILLEQMQQQLMNQQQLLEQQILEQRMLQERITREQNSRRTPLQTPSHSPGVAPAMPNRNEVEDYRQRLELRLLERYNNLPDYAGNVGKVEVILSKPIEESLDGSKLRAEFDQLVYDPWGRRIPKLEEEYFVVTFAAGGAQQVRTDPSVRVGLDHEQGFSERAPLSADPFTQVQTSKAFTPAPAPKSTTKKMADWWRPDFPELE